MQPIASLAPEHGTDTWQAGPPESDIALSLRHLLFTQITGRVTRWRAVAAIDLAVPARSWVDVTADANSLELGDAERDAHVRSPEFLDSRSYPEIRFRSADVLSLEDGRRFTVEGALTIRGVTRPVVLELQRVGGPPSLNPPPEVIALTGRMVIDRQDFGLRWNQDLDRQGIVVGNQVEVTMRIMARRQSTGT